MRLSACLLVEYVGLAYEIGKGLYIPQEYTYAVDLTDAADLLYWTRPTGWLSRESV